MGTSSGLICDRGSVSKLIGRLERVNLQSYIIVAAPGHDLPLSSVDSLILIGGVSILTENEHNNYYQQCLPTILPVNTSVRVHYPVRRFPMFNDTRIVDRNPSFIIIDKPHLLPSQPYKGNRWENAQGFVECNGVVPKTFEDVRKITEDSKRPSLLNRLDLPVSGLLFLGDSDISRSTFMRMSKENKIKKQYLAVSEKKIGTGVKRLLLFTKDERGGGGMGGSKGQVLCSSDLRMSKKDGWTKCIMDVNRREEFSVEGKTRYEYTINLVTGRKHQIRSCMAFLGASLIGDSLYGPMENKGVEFEMEREEVEALEKGLQDGNSVRKRIGLRCVGVSVEERVFRADEGDFDGGKWWRKELE
ncbi:hypothetical protein TL16_g03150 [Triparma laevis f. inornata]|uniref:Pseudouridine synthase RsuA/RluA-like domain-containing protein n=1 Tax=Triparma laevis f. inornata TaxID=1714386 RepID=A0A9W7A2Q0_9STRA|nr:hypothetical protein TL16_g03150 [Triparma laevis f. inornata]